MPGHVWNSAMPVGMAGNLRQKPELLISWQWRQTAEYAHLLSCRAQDVLTWNLPYTLDFAQPERAGKPFVNGLTLDAKNEVDGIHFWIMACSGCINVRQIRLNFRCIDSGRSSSNSASKRSRWVERTICRFRKLKGKSGPIFESTDHTDSYRFDVVIACCLIQLSNSGRNLSSCELLSTLSQAEPMHGVCYPTASTTCCFAFNDLTAISSFDANV